MDRPETFRPRTVPVGLDAATAATRRRFDSVSRYYDFLDLCGLNRLRRKAVGLARGKVLEVGVGTGKNLPLYGPGCQVTAVDLSPKMLERAEARARTAPMPVELREADAQNLPFPDEAFDTVLATYAFCSVPDPIRGLREVRRVCRRDGQVVLLEHVRSANRVIGRLMDLMDPVANRFMGNHINRRTVENVHRAGLTVLSNDPVGGPIVRLIVARP